LVAIRYTQHEGIDYFETFNPVVKLATIRVVLSIALSQGWSLHQLDVNNVFLHGDLEETIYMEHPSRFVDPVHPNHVCKLKKAIYGLKQAPRAWFSILKTFLQTLKLYSQSDPSLFILNTTELALYLLMYVDDIIIIDNNSTVIQSLLWALDTEFSIKDFGSLSYFLGIEVTHHASHLHLS
jgi:Reverse transcriptase (RNA-dependent DNA polymerase)